MIPVSDYSEIFARRTRRGRGDDGFAVSENDEKAFEEARVERAKLRGVDADPVMTEEEIRNWKS